MKIIIKVNRTSKLFWVPGSGTMRINMTFVSSHVLHAGVLQVFFGSLSLSLTVLILLTRNKFSGSRKMWNPLVIDGLSWTNNKGMSMLTL